jgi:hypothetical protein
MQSFDLTAQSKKYRLKDVGINRRTVLKRVVRKQCRRVYTGFIWLRIQSGDLTRSFRGKETSGSVEGGEFLDSM